MLSAGSSDPVQELVLATGSECFELGKFKALTWSKKPLVIKTPFISSA